MTQILPTIASAAIFPHFTWGGVVRVPQYLSISQIEQVGIVGKDDKIRDLLSVFGPVNTPVITTDKNLSGGVCSGLPEFISKGRFLD